MSLRVFQSQKTRPSLVTPPHTSSKRVPRHQETHTWHLTPAASTGRHLDLLLAGKPHLGVSPASLPISSAQAKKGNMLTRKLRLKATRLESHVATTVGRAKHTNTSHPSHSSSLKVRDKTSGIWCAGKTVFNTSSTCLAKMKWALLQFHRCAAFSTSINHFLDRKHLRQEHNARAVAPSLLVAVDRRCAPALQHIVRWAFSRNPARTSGGISVVT